MSARLAAGLGYDPDRVAELSPRLRRALAVVALSSLPALVLLTAAAGYGAYLASDVVGLGVAVGLGGGLYLLNLLRVAVAGGGVGPQQPYANVTSFMPRTVPLVMLALLGVFFAQPLILAGLAREQDPQVDELRRALVQLHTDAMLKPLVAERTRAEASLQSARSRLTAAQATLEARKRELASLGGPGRLTVERAVAEDTRTVEAARAEVDRLVAALAAHQDREARVSTQDLEPYQRHLARSHFLLRRVQLTWEAPLRPLLATLAMVLLMVLPWVTSATVGRTAARAYEAARWKMNRALIDTAYAEARRREAAALSQWPTFEGPRLELHEDAPYNTRPRAGAGTYEARHG